MTTSNQINTDVARCHGWRDLDRVPYGFQSQERHDCWHPSRFDHIMAVRTDSRHIYQRANFVVAEEPQ